MNPEIPKLPNKIKPSLTAMLPPHLKDPANYERIQKIIIETLGGTCSHGEIMQWANCVKCQKRFKERKNVLKKLGFKNPAQYLEWKKIHMKIREKYPLVDWSKLNAERRVEVLKNG